MSMKCRMYRKLNLFPEIFNFDEIPKIAFNQRLVPMRMPKEIWITDTTFRDGQQSRAFTAEQILRLYDMMHELGGPKRADPSERILCSQPAGS